MLNNTKKSFELLYNTSQRLKNIEIDADKVFVFNEITQQYVPVGAIVPEEAKDIVKKIKQMRENELSFFIGYQAPIAECINELSPHELKLLFFLACNAQYGNKVYDMGYQEIAKRAKMSKETVSKAMRVLKDRKLIHAKPIKNRFIYTINPSVFWRGSYYGIKDTMNLFVDNDAS